VRFLEYVHVSTQMLATGCSCPPRSATPQAKIKKLFPDPGLIP